METTSAISARVENSRTLEAEILVSLIRRFTLVECGVAHMARETRRLLLAVSLALLVVLAGCSGGGSDSLKGEQSAATVSGGEQQDQSADTSNSDVQGQDAQVRKRALIRTGTVSIEVDDYDAARRNLTQETRQLGGFVSDSSEQVHTRENQSWTTGTLVLRVPKENFSTLLSKAKQTGEVRKASTSTKDVTEKLVDIEARLKNLKAQRERLRGLYRNASDTENVLEVQERLSEVQSEIERLEAQRKALKREVAYSTITVELNEPRPEPTTEDTDSEKWYETGLLAAFLSSVNGVVVLFRGLAVGVAYAMPYVLALGVPIGGAVAVWRRRQSGHAGGTDLPNVPDGPDEEEP